MKILIPVALLALVGCYIEPSGLTWTGDQTTATSCDLGNGVTVTADGPVYCQAMVANWKMAHDAIIARGITTEEEWGLMMKNMQIQVHTTQRCISAPGDGNSCTYAVTHMDGSDSFNWTPASQEYNRDAVQMTHEALHVICAWNNIPNSNHQGWDQNGYMDLGEKMAEEAFHVTP